MDKTDILFKIKDDMESDKTLPLINKPEDIIPGDGNPNAQIVFIGEAGGYYESVQRKPFVGQAGQLLNKGLSAIKINRDDVYITNMVKTRPPNNRDPFPEELKAYENYLDRELAIIEPELIITLGRFSMAKFLPNVFISQVHGKEFEVDFKGRKIIVYPMYHPAAALRNGDIMAKFKEDFLRIPSILEKINSKKTDNIEDKEEQMSLV